MSPRNAVIHNQLAMLELATLECEALGIEVETVEWFDIGKPRLVVKIVSALRHLIKTGKAFNYGSEVKKRHPYLPKSNDGKGVKIIWKSDVTKH